MRWPLAKSKLARRLAKYGFLFFLIKQHYRRYF